MTPHGFTQLESELDELKNVGRKEVVSAIAAARELGDLKENAEYHAARERQSFIEGRIEEITSKLSNAQIIDVTKMQNKGKVIFGATVCFRNTATNKARTVQIVGEDEAAEGTHKISVFSPIARGLIGKLKTEKTIITTPTNTYELQIESVEYI